MRISDWSSDVCSSDLLVDFCERRSHRSAFRIARQRRAYPFVPDEMQRLFERGDERGIVRKIAVDRAHSGPSGGILLRRARCRRRSEEHTSELQSLMRISDAGFCLNNKIPNNTRQLTYTHVGATQPD